MKYVIYDRPLNGRAIGEGQVISDTHARRLEIDGIATIYDHPQFPAPGAKHFAGLPPAIPAPADPPARRAGKRRD